MSLRGVVMCLKCKILSNLFCVTNKGWIYRVSQKKGIDKKLLFGASCSRLQFTVFEFIWIQYICKLCLVHHLKDLDASR